MAKKKSKKQVKKQTKKLQKRAIKKQIKLTQRQKKELNRLKHNLQNKVYRSRIKIEQLSKKKLKGWKSKRSREYAKIIVANKQRIGLNKKYGIKVKRKKQVTIEYKVKDKKAVYADKVWEFEKTLQDYLKKGKQFKEVYFKDLNKRFKVTKNNISKIIMAYDDARNTAYISTQSTTPQVVVEEDFKGKTLTIEVTH